MKVMQERELPVLNRKAGYDRRRSVAGIGGGSSMVGAITATGSVRRHVHRARVRAEPGN